MIEFFDYMRMHVKLHGKRVDSMTPQEVGLAFCMLPPPRKVFEEVKAIHDALFGNPVQSPVQSHDQELQDNKAAFERIAANSKKDEAVTAS